MNLTVAEIIDLARFSGCVLMDESQRDKSDDETEIEITECPKDGLMHENDEPTRRHYAHVASYADYPDEGVMGLGPELVKHEVGGLNANRSVATTGTAPTHGTPVCLVCKKTIPIGFYCIEHQPHEGLKHMQEQLAAVTAERNQGLDQISLCQDEIIRIGERLLAMTADRDRLIKILSQASQEVEAIASKRDEYRKEIRVVTADRNRLLELVDCRCTTYEIEQGHNDHCIHAKVERYRKALEESVQIKGCSLERRSGTEFVCRRLEIAKKALEGK